MRGTWNKKKFKKRNRSDDIRGIIRRRSGDRGGEREWDEREVDELSGAGAMTAGSLWGAEPVN